MKLYVDFIQVTSFQILKVRRFDISFIINIKDLSLEEVFAFFLRFQPANEIIKLMSGLAETGCYGLLQPFGESIIVEVYLEESG